MSGSFRNEPRELPPILEVIPWLDPIAEEAGFAPRSDYVEVCWGPVLGPSALFAYRRLGSWAIAEPEGLTVDTIDLATSLGLGEGLAKNGLFPRAVGRLVLFQAAKWWGDSLAVRRALPPVPEHMAGHLSWSALQAHRQAMGARAS